MGRFLFVIFLLLVGAVAGATWLFLGSFRAFTGEAPVAEIHLSEIAPQRFAADIAFHNGASATYALAGDYFLVEAEVITFDNWATMLGEAPRVRLTKLAGNYFQIIEGAVYPCDTGGRFDLAEPCRTVYDLSDAQYAIEADWVPNLMQRFGQMFMDVTKADRTPFFSGAGITMTDGAHVWVCMTEDALVIRDGTDGCRTGALD